MIRTRIVTFNAGSSGIKTAVFDLQNIICEQRKSFANSAEALIWATSFSSNNDVCFGHRVVHGGRKYHSPTLVTTQVTSDLQTLIPLAPLHEPAAIELIEKVTKLFPDAKQIACFDTAFHRANSELEKLLPLPSRYSDSGVERYGFHGLSYQYIASILPDIAGEIADKKVIVAHLGGGSSMCAMRNLKSVASTMGFSALEGLMMATRTGSIDAGVILYMLEEEKLSLPEVTKILYEESGLKGVSGISGDVRELEKSNSKTARTAIQLYCYIAAKQLGGLMNALGGIDALVFTGGIGENSTRIREQICSYIEWVGCKVDEPANSANNQQISAADSRVGVYVVPTDEELVIARECKKLLGF